MADPPAHLPAHGFHTQLDTSDIDEAREIVAASYVPHGIAVLGAAADFRARQRSLEHGALAIDLLSYGTDSLVVPFDPLGQTYCIMHAMRGNLTVSAGPRELLVGPGDSAALDPEVLFRMRWHDGLVVRNLRLDPAALTRYWRGITGQAGGVPPSLSAAAPKSAEDALRWQRCVNLVQRSLSDPAVREAGPLWWATFEEYVVGTLFITHAAEEDPPRRGDGLLPGALRRALREIDERAHEPLVLADLCMAAGVSRRTLQRAFERHLGTTPLRYLNQVRLERARQDLRAGRSAVTVAEVAARWGFGNPGRFSRAYAERFGELPGESKRA
ncbi:helix-turn-helix transcriptional regulator [Flexivirga meconopsidis]|uniref:helix-turn-helix transcriptional regulator n=1 Tax=Flexivirga meconopsidis TaxID=2977121 RepID=UPI00223FA779|nr:AraC family transcriptional regulator [Flexivirga meconopsidis]